MVLFERGRDRMKRYLAMKDKKFSTISHNTFKDYQSKRNNFVYYFKGLGDVKMMKDFELFIQSIEELNNVEKIKIMRHTQKIENESNKKMTEMEKENIELRQELDTIKKTLKTNTSGELENIEKQSFYKCGHKADPIIMNYDVINYITYLDWLETTGYNGDKTECFSCYCARMRK